MKALSANMNWTQNQGIDCPKVSIAIRFENNNVLVHFDVLESRDCYIANIAEDGGPCYQDSCVELFLQTTDGEYRNFEFNSFGYCLSAKGPDRYNRTPLTAGEYSKIKRSSNIENVGDKIHWTLDATIPATFDISKIGNAYKCADNAKTPHYLSLFPIDTPKPDFHRPEFFKELGD